MLSDLWGEVYVSLMPLYSAAALWAPVQQAFQNGLTMFLTENTTHFSAASTGDPKEVIINMATKITNNAFALIRIPPLMHTVVFILKNLAKDQRENHPLSLRIKPFEIS
jgi:hypothetical protein